MDVAFFFEGIALVTKGPQALGPLSQTCHRPAGPSRILLAQNMRFCCLAEHRGQFWTVFLRSGRNSGPSGHFLTDFISSIYVHCLRMN